MNGGRQSGVYTSLDPHLQLLEHSRDSANLRTSLREFTKLAILSLRFCLFFNSTRLALNLRPLFWLFCVNVKACCRGCVSTY